MIIFSYKKLVLLLYIILTALQLMTETLAEPPVNYGDVNAGTVNNPFLIANLANLRWLSETPEYWNKTSFAHYHFMQIADIDAYETRYWHDGRGFNPIGYRCVCTPFACQTAFRGYYNGNNLTISNLYINNPTSVLSICGYPRIGMFGRTERSVIKNIRLINIEYILTASNVHRPSIWNIGGLIATAHNTSISNSSTSGYIMVDLDNVEEHLVLVGGLISFGSESTIENSYSTVHIIENTETGVIGGLAGYLIMVDIRNSFFYGTIESYYQKENSGGLVGTDTTRSSLKNNYVSGSSVFANVNSFIGSLIASNIESNLWDTETTGIEHLYNTAEGGFNLNNNYGLSSIELKQAETYIELGWDFDTIWTIEPSINDGYPYLQSFLHPTTKAGIITGKITTVNGTALEGVVVSLRGTDFRMISDADGTYSFLFAPVGIRTVMAAKNGYVLYESDEFEIEEGITTEHNFSMQINERFSEPPSNYHESNAGTIHNPFLISNLANLRWLSETRKYWGVPRYNNGIVRYYFLQTADIDAYETRYWNQKSGFNQIGIAPSSVVPPGEELYFFGDYDEVVLPSKMYLSIILNQTTKAFLVEQQTH